MSELDSSAKAISNPPDPARIMDGLRDTGYDFNTAVSDIIDNSIAADATEIYVRVEADPNMNVTVTIADNGIGMDYDGLKNAMKYGSDKRPDAKSLGKFGLGLKTASTAFCKKLSVVSRPAAGADALKVCWDLDFISKMNDWSLLVPEATDDDLDLLDQAAKGDSGTVVIWENIDRLFRRSYSSPTYARKALDRFISDLRDHIELVYQRFLDRRFSDVQDVRIWLNDEEVKPFDPFCTEIHHLSEEDILTAPTIAEIADDIKAFIADSPLVAHNAQFDIKVLNASLASWGLEPVMNPYFCTLSLARKVMKGEPSYRLTALAQRFGWEYDAHNALADSEICGKLFKKLCGDALLDEKDAEAFFRSIYKERKGRYPKIPQL